ncbi:MAG: hypothetical protein JXQ30_11530 [Spirochaetes bacterium]|nr:hypothetical protein [Spirochaetota bacterium]
MHIQRITAVLLLIVFLILSPAAVQARRLFYAEEFYLYVMNLYPVNGSLERNIRFMQWALAAPFDNPVNSLAKIESENDWARYKVLFRLHVNLLIIDSYLQLGKRFDKEHLYFFNLWYAENLAESFTVARYCYETALIYWNEAERQADAAGALHGRIDMDDWEDDLFLIQEGTLDYETIISEHLGRLDSKIRRVEDYLRTAGTGS